MEASLARAVGLGLRPFPPAAPQGWAGDVVPVVAARGPGEPGDRHLLIQEGK